MTNSDTASTKDVKCCDRWMWKDHLCGNDKKLEDLRLIAIGKLYDESTQDYDSINVDLASAVVIVDELINSIKSLKEITHSES